MKAFFTVFSLSALLLLGACIKTDPPGDFVLNASADITIHKTVPGYPSGVVKQFEIKYNSGTPESVTLSREGLPPGMSYQLTPADAYLPFSGSLSITDSSGDTGEYPLRLKAVTASKKEKWTDINLVVKGVPDCIESVEGDYAGYFTDIFSSPAVNKIVKVNDSTVTMSNFAASGKPLSVSLLCSEHKVQISSQPTTLNGAACTVSGTGSYTTDYVTGFAGGITFNLTIVDVQTNVQSFRMYYLDKHPLTGGLL